MKKLIIILISSALFTSCDNGKRKNYISVCSCAEKEKANQFVQTSIKNANNMADEEMEDVIRQLQHTSIELNCHKEVIEYIQESGTWDKTLVTKLDSCETVMWP